MAAILTASLGAGAAQAQAQAKMAGNVPKWVASATKVGEADQGKTVRLAAFLGFRNHDQLLTLISHQSTPGTPEYNKFLTAAQFRARFAPSAQDEAAVEAGLRAAGFTVVGKPTSNLYVEFTGTVAQVKAAFGVSQSVYSYNGKLMRANAEEPTLPASLKGKISGIVGLSETGKLIHPFHHSINDDNKDAKAKFAAFSAAAATDTAGPAVTIPVAANLPSPYCSNYFGDAHASISTAVAPYSAQTPWLVCSYTPQQMRAAYGADKTSLDGSGVTVAIVDAFDSPTLVSDLNQYSKNHNLPAIVPGTNFLDLYRGNLANVANNDACSPQGWFGEISLDVDAVHAIAPGANIIYAGALSCSNADLFGAIYTVVDGTATAAGPLADVISNSWGSTGEPDSVAELNVQAAIFEQAAAEGVSVLVSSGDNGDVATDIGVADASSPASNPLVTAVGGTTLALTDSKGTKSEWGWGTFRAFLTNPTVNSAYKVTDSGAGGFSFYSGAGGGPSLVWLQPSYQVGVVPKWDNTLTFDLNGVKYHFPAARSVPDVAMDADPYTGFLIGETYTIAGDAVSDYGCTKTSDTLEYCEEGIGGTSLASPLFAGVLALVNQQRHLANLGDIGFANPRLYALKVGAPGSTTTPLVDVRAPAAPKAMLRGYANNLNRVRLVTINSVPGPYGPVCTISFCGAQDSWTLQTKPNYDNVTGLGVPYIPALVASLGTAP